MVSEQDYKQQINQVIRFLSGDAGKIRQELIEQMNVASETEHYELAARFRDRIKSINSVIEKQNIIGVEITDCDHSFC